MHDRRHGEEGEQELDGRREGNDTAVFTQHYASQCLIGCGNPIEGWAGGSLTRCRLSYAMTETSRRTVQLVHTRKSIVFFAVSIVKCITEFGRRSYSYLVPPVPLGASGDEKSPSLTVTGDPAGSMPADTHLFQVFFEYTSLSLLRPPPFFCRFMASSTLLYICEGLSLRSRRMLQAISILLVVTMSWSRSIPALLITSSFVTLMITSLDTDDSDNQAADGSRPADGNNVVMTMWLLHARNTIGEMRIKTSCYNR